MSWRSISRNSISEVVWVATRGEEEEGEVEVIVLWWEEEGGVEDPEPALIEGFLLPIIVCFTFTSIY